MLHDISSFNVRQVDDEHIHVSYDGSIVSVPLIDYNSLVNNFTQAKKDLDDERKKLEREQKSNAENNELVADLCSYTTLKWYEENKGAKKGCGRLADALIVADSVRGMSIGELLNKKYPYKRNGMKYYEQRKIFSALSTKKPDDLKRINDLLRDYPDAFNGISINDVFEWFRKRSSKGGKNL